MSDIPAVPVWSVMACNFSLGALFWRVCRGKHGSKQPPAVEPGLLGAGATSTTTACGRCPRIRPARSSNMVFEPNTSGQWSKPGGDTGRAEMHWCILVLQPVAGCFNQYEYRNYNKTCSWWGARHSPTRLDKVKRHSHNPSEWDDGPWNLLNG